MVMQCSKIIQERLRAASLSMFFFVLWNVQLQEVASIGFKMPSIFEGAQYLKSSDLERNRTRAMLNSFSFSHTSGYVSSSSCNEGGYFSGARVRVSSMFNQTYPFVAAVEFICSDGIKPTVPADKVLLLQKNVGNWTEKKECPNGAFVSGVTLFMTSVSNENMIAGQAIPLNETLNDQNAERFFDVFEFGRTRYISGISLNCSFNRDYNNDLDGLLDNDGSSAGLIPAWRNTVTMGRPSRMGMRLYCSDDKVVAGISVEQEALITHEDGKSSERWIPMDIILKCMTLTNPVKHCYPELDWEKIDNMTCTNMATGKDAMFEANHSGISNVTCQVAHFVGLSPNHDIENLQKILRAYDFVDLEGATTRFYLRSKLLTPLFQKEWQRTYKLSIDDYIKVVAEMPLTTYLSIKEETRVINFTNVNYEEPTYSKQIRNATSEPLKYDFNVKQLVGYCNIYKIYFPLFKSQFHVYFERKIDNINSRIIFPQVDIDDTLLADIIESKLGIKL